MKLVIDKLTKPVLVCLSLFGAFAVTEPFLAHWGYLAWMISNVGWMILFVEGEFVWEACLFWVYFLLATKGFMGW